MKLKNRMHVELVRDMRKFYNGVMRRFACALCLVFAVSALAGFQDQEDPDRFEKAVRALERSTSDSDADARFADFRRLLDALDKQDDDLRKRAGREWDASERAEYEKLHQPMQAHRELRWLKPEIVKLLVRSLGQSSQDQRIASLKVLAKAAREDFPMKDDDVFFGPSCGTYDHTSEHKIEWAARRYPKESLAALRAPAWNGRTYLLQALQLNPDWHKQPGIEPVLVRLSSDANTLVRGQAILMLSQFPGEATNSILRLALTNRAADTRAKALVTIANLKVLDLEPQVLSLAKDRVPDVKAQAIEALGKFSTPGAKESLIQMLQTEKELRWHVLTTLGESKCTEAAPYIHRLFQDEKEDGRSQMLTVLTQLDPQTGAEEIERSLKGTDEDLINTALYLAGELKLERARRLVQKHLGHKDEYVRSTAQRALAQLDGREPGG